MNRTLATTAAAAVMGVSALTAAAPAHAAADNIVWVDGSYSRCIDKQRTYVSSWTKITKACYRRDLGGYMGHQFHWTTVG